MTGPLGSTCDCTVNVALVIDRLASRLLPVRIAAKVTQAISTHKLNLKGPFFLFDIAGKPTQAILRREGRQQLHFFPLDIYAKVTQPAEEEANDIHQLVPTRVDSR